MGAILSSPNYGGLRVQGVGTPLSSTDAATMAWVLSLLAGAMTLTSDPTTTSTVAAAASAAAVRVGSGWVSGVLVTTVGTAALTITDGAGGNIIAFVQANQPAGWIPFPRPVHYATSIYVNSGTNTPAITVSYV